MAGRSDVIDGLDGVSARNGLIYTCACGWIDLGHARPDGARALWSQISNGTNHVSSDGTGFKVSYSQFMRKAGVGVGMSRAYWVRKNLSRAEKESVALSIFMEVSKGFETLQDSWPFKWGTDSGFSAEDLMSNLVGFYRAVRPTDADYIADCKPVSKKAALAVWDASGAVGAKKNRSFTPILFPCSECNGNNSGQLPAFLNSIVPAKKGARTPDAIKNKGTLFRDWSFLDDLPGEISGKLYWLNP
jgi:hypothetical protein